MFKERLPVSGDVSLSELQLVVVMPAYNEALSIAQTITDYQHILPEARIIVVDNNSTDQTFEIASKLARPGVDLVLREPRQGKGNAVKQGLSRLYADIYLMTDADNTYSASEARRLVEVMLDTRCDMVVGDRLSSGSYTENNKRLGHSWGNRFLSFFISTLSGRKYSDVLSGLRVMSNAFISSLDVRSSGFQLETELNIISAYVKADVVEVPIVYLNRPEGSLSKLSTVKDGFRILKFAIVNWIGFFPIQFFMTIATVSILGFFIFSYRVINGFLETGSPYSTSAVAAAALGLLASFSVFSGLILKVLGRSIQREEIASFLRAKRMWNSVIDSNIQKKSFRF